jgi:hypothetical protein
MKDRHSSLWHCFAARGGLVLGACLFGTISSAGPITYSFGGTVTTAADMGGLVAPGESWTLIASYDGTSPVPAGPGTEYPLIGNVEVSFSGGLSGTFASGALHVQNDDFSRDLLQFQLGSPTFPPVGSNAFFGGAFFLEDSNATAISSEMPPTVIDPSQWDSILFSLRWNSSFDPSRDPPFIDPAIRGNVTSASVNASVPESGSTLLLLLLGLAGLTSFRRYRRTAS